MNPFTCNNCGAPATGHKPCRYCGATSHQLPRTGGARIEIRNVTIGDDLSEAKVCETIERLLVAPGKPVFA